MGLEGGGEGDPDCIDVKCSPNHLRNMLGEHEGFLYYCRSCRVRVHGLFSVFRDGDGLAKGVRAYIWSMWGAL